ncbi:unnamed protein product [Heterobilharzia americana]|nr:unnamed protein product [Heterobilharzia americana]
MESIEDEELFDFYHFNNTGISDYPHDSAVWIYAAPILIVAGVTENSISLIILLSQRFKTLPSRFTLMILAIIDSLVLFFGLIRYWINGVFETQPSEWSEIWCKLMSMIVFTLSHLSSCLVALLSIERFFAVYLPQHKFKPSIDYFGSVLLIILCTCINLIHLKYTVLEKNPLFHNKNITLPEPGLQTELHIYVCVNPSIKIAILIDVLDVLLLFVLPFLIIVICNSYVIWKLTKHSNRLKYTTNNNLNLHSMFNLQNGNISLTMNSDIEQVKSYSVISVPFNYQAHSKYINSAPVYDKTKDCQNKPIHQRKLKTSITKRHLRITNTLLVVTFAFLVCNLPFAVIHIIRTADDTYQSDLWNKAWMISYLLVYINNCMNFPIYIISQPPFRSEFKKILCRTNKD